MLAGAIQMIPVAVHKLPDGFFKMMLVGEKYVDGRLALQLFTHPDSPGLIYYKFLGGGLYYTDATEIAREIRNNFLRTEGTIEEPTTNGGA